MTRDDREDARRGEEGGAEPSRWKGGRPASGTGPRLGGLFDGLPESGRGARAQPPRGSSGTANPFRQRPRPPAPADPAPRVPSAPVSPYGALPLDIPPAPRPEAEPTVELAADAPSPTGSPHRPDVIPFRGGERPAGSDAASPGAVPSPVPGSPESQAGPEWTVPSAESEHPAEPSGPAEPEPLAEPEPSTALADAAALARSAVLAKAARPQEAVPAHGTTTARAAAPARPVTPARPAVPVRPAAPARQGAPAQPPAPPRPAEPVHTAASAHPAAPPNTEVPARPDTPAPPVASARPATSAPPTGPARPAAPTRPAVPARPATHPARTVRPPGTTTDPEEAGAGAAGAPTTDHGRAEQHSATTEPEQSMHAHEPSEPLPGPAGPPVQTAPEPAAASTAQAPERAGNGSVHAYGEAERAAVYRAIRERRDVRTGFRPDPVPHDVLIRVLEAAHQAPSVGDSQPWDFLVIEDPGLRARVGDLAAAEREDHAHAPPGVRARAFAGLKAEAVLDAPLNIAVTVDPTRGGRHARGRHARPLSADHAAALAVENLWIAARAEGLGVGWLTFVDERDVARALELPAHLDVAAYLCVGYVEEFPAESELSLSGWARERPLSWAVHHDRYGRRGLPGREPTSLLEETITAVGALDTRAMEEARDRQDRMTKPPGSLGFLEEVSVQLAGISGQCPPPIPDPAAVAVFAGDHGVHAQGVTHWPQEVTAQMVHNFLEGGAVVNAFAAQVGAEVTVVDVGVAADLPRAPGLLARKVARGTADLTQGPALTREQTLQALECGIEVARDLVSAGNRCLVTGDMGIANTTPAAALVCAFTGADPAHATGRGTGVDDAVYAHKVDVVRRALAEHPVDPADPIGTLAALGGLEHAALAGFVLGGAALRVPVLLDGVIAGSAALAAAAISPEALSACFAGHRSSEPGHSLALEHLGLRPLVDLEMRLGEGSGALLALPLLQSAARVLHDVATFDDAGVSTAP
ncbi:nicotinate-nucleotide--dimethylbenzimidazole phosphoribosyltransferase [Nocardiopsis dassonvillei]|uniref:Nicotinate-nucleotide--dimethylbenzimidazole phosphoribosyltransferase n=4 Tax=Nocardiopsis TaxID=2013 RepID=D7B3S0_NOCDD|nr:nicotinate-nucleotide--dimethylbenzimidazole phosphoribosyltransferase [Nocardiopsis dassonvillei]ADH68837.1 nicotinate-nucleotide/dimethylbenzimidazole phosphoribosyltransferase [Nocardiopsis dassonvillei subsp. dassonvillei DSM 43111]VEI89346.1 Nicotinate-nucleotide--dimethylbenzimidazole phosphoribosyltransferase [Nocardiopsis dassonvillei]